MPLTIRSSLRQSTSPINCRENIPNNKKSATTCTVTSGGFEVQNSKTRNIKPLASCLKPGLRMPADEYLKFKELMDNINSTEAQKQVRFNLPEPSVCATNTVPSSPSSLTNGALYDDDTDLVPFEEFEPWRLQRETLLKNRQHHAQINQVTPALPSDANNILQPHADAAHYSTPRMPAISTDYAMPNPSAKSAHYDIPNPSAKSAHYDIPGKPAISTHYSIPRHSGELSYDNIEKRSVRSRQQN
ncbi:hypothetical protein L8P27_05220 [Enterobacter asburiae]|uniref:hypothetical protein n=1 Tax=Enterobacter asburiae TaxID=61645 RepID=UPI002005CF28|nr:hypothetical protein [Enterobacter asburiae]MCK7227252.1 hypothetical protein [Enterobacter asburiae]